MTTTHTPGPWTVQTLGEKINGYPDWNSYCIRHLNQNVHIATVGHVDRYYEQQNEANARLIAAAPDLLAALKKSVQFVAKYANDHDSKIAFRMLAQMHAAIDKAGGDA